MSKLMRKNPCWQVNLNGHKKQIGNPFFVSVCKSHFAESDKLDVNACTKPTANLYF